MNVIGNTIPIKRDGETLACIDPLRVEAVIPDVAEKPSRNESLMEKMSSFFRGDKVGGGAVKATRIIFKDGTSVRLEMPFSDFVNAYP